MAEETRDLLYTVTDGSHRESVIMTSLHKAVPGNTIILGEEFQHVILRGTSTVHNTPVNHTIPLSHCEDQVDTRGKNDWPFL